VICLGRKTNYAKKYNSDILRVARKWKKDIQKMSEKWEFDEWFIFTDIAEKLKKIL